MSGRAAAVIVGTVATLVGALHCGAGADAAHSGSAGGGGGGDASLDAGAQDAPAYASPVPFTIVTEPDTGCVATTAATAASVYASAPSFLAFVDLQAAGPRRLARAVGGEGFVLFDVDGRSASQAPITVGDTTSASASASDVLAAGLDPAGHAHVQRFDLSGTRAGADVDLGAALAHEPVAIGRSGAKALVAWALPSGSPALHGRVLDASGAWGNADVVIEAGQSFADLSIAILPSHVSDGSDFLIVWALHREFLRAYRVYAALVNASGLVGLPKLLFGSDTPVRIIGAADHEGGGVLLLDRGGVPLVVPVDVLGVLSGPAHELQGLFDATLGGGQGIARRGSEVAIVGRHTSDAHAFRRLDLTGKPLDGFVCLDAPLPGGFHLAGVAPDGAGYSAIMATASEGTALVRVDSTGRGPLAP